MYLPFGSYAQLTGFIHCVYTFILLFIHVCIASTIPQQSTATQCVWLCISIQYVPPYTISIPTHVYKYGRQSTANRVEKKRKTATTNSKNLFIVPQISIGNLCKCKYCTLTIELTIYILRDFFLIFLFGYNIESVAVNTYYSFILLYFVCILCLYAWCARELFIFFPPTIQLSDNTLAVYIHIYDNSVFFHSLHKKQCATAIVNEWFIIYFYFFFCPLLYFNLIKFGSKQKAKTKQKSLCNLWVR